MNTIKIYYPCNELNPQDFDYPEQIAHLQLIQQQEWLDFLKSNPTFTQKVLHNRQIHGYYNHIIQELARKATYEEDKTGEWTFNLKQWELENPEYLKCQKRIQCLSDYFYELVEKQNFDFLKNLKHWSMPNESQAEKILEALKYDVQKNKWFALANIDMDYLNSLFDDLPSTKKHYRISYHVQVHCGDCTAFPASCEQCLTEEYFGFDTRLARKHDMADFGF